MKKLIHKKWLSIPVTVFLVLVLTAGAVFASGAIRIGPVDQTITQEVVAPPIDYGTISAPDIVIPDVYTGGIFSKNAPDAVVVELEPDGEGKWLIMVCTYDPLYTDFDVTLSLTSKPDGSELDIGASCGTTGERPTGWGAIMLDVAGTYLFDQTIEGVAGDTSGAASSTVTFTLEDTNL